MQRTCRRHMVSERTSSEHYSPDRNSTARYRPCKRMQHRAAVCNTGIANNMMVIFYGRIFVYSALNENIYCKKQERQVGRVKTPKKNTNMTEIPLSRYRHYSMSCNSFIVVYDSRTQKVTDKGYLETYESESYKWYRFLTVQWFRHSSWIVDNRTYIHNGFEPKILSSPTDIIYSIDLKKLIESNSQLNYIIKCMNNVDDKKKSTKINQFYSESRILSKSSEIPRKVYRSDKFL
eukprot:Mrub_02737.p1 GENE.Mrub_02737~~Mrub_02737.p1  ORF type:complete len:234 (+),score=12.30 Mrub_02737:229-930(+)